MLMAVGVVWLSSMVSRNAGSGEAKSRSRSARTTSPVSSAGCSTRRVISTPAVMRHGSVDSPGPLGWWVGREGREECWVAAGGEAGQAIRQMRAGHSGLLATCSSQTQRTHSPPSRSSCTLRFEPAGRPDTKKMLAGQIKAHPHLKRMAPSMGMVVGMRPWPSVSSAPDSARSGGSAPYSSALAGGMQPTVTPAGQAGTRATPLVK